MCIPLLCIQYPELKDVWEHNLVSFLLPGLEMNRVQRYLCIQEMSLRVMWLNNDFVRCTAVVHYMYLHIPAVVEQNDIHHYLLTLSISTWYCTRIKRHCSFEGNCSSYVDEITLLA
jgi:hypothetical protein